MPTVGTAGQSQTRSRGEGHTFFSWASRLGTGRQLVRLVRSASLWVVSRRQVLKRHALCVVALLAETALLLPGVAGRSTALRELASVLLWESARLLLLEALLGCSVAGLTTEIALSSKVTLTTSVWLP